MTDNTDTTPDIEDREANIRMHVQEIIGTGYAAMYERLDGLKERGVTDTDVLDALQYLEEPELREEYAVWQGVDLRHESAGDDGVVPDPDNASYAPLRDALDADRARRNADLGLEILERLKTSAENLRRTATDLQERLADPALGGRPDGIDLIRYQAFAAQAETSHQVVKRIVEGKR